MAIGFPRRPGSHSASVPAAEEDEPSPDELVDFDDSSTEIATPFPGSPEPRPLAPGDAVPIFRTDLVIEKGPTAGLFEVVDPVTGRHFTLYEFELSVARMLDGRRHASDVMESGVRLGIPVDRIGLYKFIRQLWRYGFLAPPGAGQVSEGAVEGEGGWPERQRWDEATRTLFQTGLRLMRQGRPGDAESYFQAVLDADPGNAEATEYLAAIERGENLAASPIGLRARGRRRSARRARRLAVALGVVAAACAAGGAWFVARRLAPPARPATALPITPPVPPPAPPAPPAWRTAAVQRREHPPLGELTAPGAGVVVWRKGSGDRVREGEKIGSFRLDPRRRGGRVREQALLAPETGVLDLTVATRLRAARGARLGAVVDDRIWIVDAFVDGKPPPADAACELRGDAVAERIPCALDGARPAEGGSQLTLTVKADEAPWLERSRSLRVRIAPPGMAPEPAPPFETPPPRAR